MKLTSAIDEYGLLQRRRQRGEAGQLAALALSALREYLIDRSEMSNSAAVTSHDLFQFLLDYYPSQEQPEPAVATALLDTCAGFARWLVERGETGTAAFAAAEERLRDDLPRVMEALRILREHAHAGDLTPVVPVGQEDDEEEEAPVGFMGSGADRVVDLDKIDYNSAQLDYFTVRRSDSEGAGGFGSLALEASSQKAMGEGLADPVRVPAAAASLLRPDDIVYGEIAPGPNGWELLEAFGVRPGRYE